MSVPARVSVVSLGVTDVARSTEFYASLGWRLSSASAPGVVSFFHTGGGVLALVGTDVMADSANVTPRTSTDFRGTMLAINVESREAVDESLRQVVQAGATLTRAGEATAWGGYVGYFTDPDGHLWEITHNAGFPLTEHGTPTLP